MFHDFLLEHTKSSNQFRPRKSTTTRMPSFRWIRWSVELRSWLVIRSQIESARCSAQPVIPAGIAPLKTFWVCILHWLLNKCVNAWYFQTWWAFSLTQLPKASNRNTPSESSISTVRHNLIALAAFKVIIQQVTTCWVKMTWNKSFSDW